jgi:hypothetical protein
VNGINVRPVELFEEKTRIGGERFDEPPLAFRKDGVERQRRLAGAGKTGYGDNFVMRQGQADIPEVVLPGTLYDEIMMRHPDILPDRQRKAASIYREEDANVIADHSDYAVRGILGYNEQCLKNCVQRFSPVVG